MKYEKWTQQRLDAVISGLISSGPAFTAPGNQSCILFASIEFPDGR